jgi:hypothetical protein
MRPWRSRPRGWRSRGGAPVHRPPPAGHRRLRTRHEPQELARRRLCRPDDRRVPALQARPGRRRAGRHVRRGGRADTCHGTQTMRVCIVGASGKLGRTWCSTRWIPATSAVAKILISVPGLALNATKARPRISAALVTRRPVRPMPSTPRSSGDARARNRLAARALELVASATGRAPSQSRATLAWCEPAVADQRSGRECPHGPSRVRPLRC